MFNTIVVGVNNTETAARALRCASELAERTDAKLHLVTACKPAPKALGLLTKWRAEVLAARSRELDASVERLSSAGLDVVGHPVEGSPAEAIAGVARTEGADLIVVGNRGITGPHRYLPGTRPQPAVAVGAVQRVGRRIDALRRGQLACALRGPAGRCTVAAEAVHLGRLRLPRERTVLS